MERAPAGARLGLWFGLLRGCDRAMADAPAQGKDPKVRLCTRPLKPDQIPVTVPALHCRLCPTGFHSFCLSVASQSVHCVSAAAAVRPTVQRAWPACPALLASGSAAACCRWRASVPSAWTLAHAHQLPAKYWLQESLAPRIPGCNDNSRKTLTAGRAAGLLRRAGQGGGGARPHRPHAPARRQGAEPIVNAKWLAPSAWCCTWHISCSMPQST